MLYPINTATSSSTNLQTYLFVVISLGIVATAAFFNLRRQRGNSLRARLEIMYDELIISFFCIIVLTGTLIFMHLENVADRLGLFLQGFVILRLFRRSWFDRRAPVMSVITTVIFFIFSIYWFKAVLPGQVFTHDTWWYFSLGLGFDIIILVYQKFRRSNNSELHSPDPRSNR